MFQFRRFPTYCYLIHSTLIRYCRTGFPHSDISGSMLICSSPKLFAACHVLHRLLMPRHSPCALISLTYLVLLELTSSHTLELCRLNRISLQNCIYPNKLKFSTFAFGFASFTTRPLLPCFSSLLCSVFKVQLRIVPSKLDNVRKEKADHRKFVGMVTNMSP